MSEENRPKSILVYFNSGNKTKLPADKTVFVKDVYVQGLMDMIRDGQFVVNWNNVCYVRESDEPEYDD